MADAPAALPPPQVRRQRCRDGRASDQRWSRRGPVPLFRSSDALQLISRAAGRESISVYARMETCSRNLRAIRCTPGPAGMAVWRGNFICEDETRWRERLRQRLKAEIFQQKSVCLGGDGFNRRKEPGPMISRAADRLGRNCALSSPRKFNCPPHRPRSIGWSDSLPIMIGLQ